MKKLVIAALFVIVAVVVSTSTVSARDIIAEQEQKQELEQKIECKKKYEDETGNYGTTRRLVDIDCEGKQSASQEQRQQVLAENTVSRGGRVHNPVNTALDTKAVVAAMGLTMVGGLAYAAKRKIA